MFELVWKKAALKSLAKCPAKIRVSIQKAMNEIAENPDDHTADVKSLTGATDYYRLRVGGYRAIFERRDQIRILIIERIGPRGNVYKR